MSRKADVYSPWRDEVAAVRARHVGRADELGAIRDAIRAFLQGRRATPIYLFGPRGTGKSHLLSLVADDLRVEIAEAGAHLVVVAEDIPELRTARELLGRVDLAALGPAWQRWGRPRAATPPAGERQRRVVFFEGFDRQLERLPDAERKQLRHEMQRGPDYFVCTGVVLGEPLTGREEAFFGTFAPYSLDLLDDREAAALLDRVTGRFDSDLAWTARREVLVTLAGGSPRALLALAEASAEAPDAWAVDQVHAVVAEFTAHYQMRFRDLSPQQQQVVELLAEAPRELTPTDLAKFLGVSSSQTSVLANRLLDGGVVRSRTEGRQTWYRLAEPLFRFWLEYRTAPWEETRVRWLGRMLETLLKPAELASTWWKSEDPRIREALDDVIRTRPEAAEAAWVEARERWFECVSAEMPGAAEAIIRRASTLAAHPSMALFCWIGALTHDPLVLLPLRPSLRGCGLLALDSALDFAETATRAGASARPALRRLIERAAEARASSVELLATEHIVASSLRNAPETGRPWRLTVAERTRLASVPWLRALFLVRGRTSKEAPLLQVADVLPRVSDAMEDHCPLLRAAASLRDSTFFARLVENIESRTKPSLPFCPQPGQPALTAPDAVTRIAARVLADAAHEVESLCALSWAASFADAAAETWEHLLEAVKRADFPRPSGPDEETQLAFCALALRSRQHYDDLRAALGAGWSAGFVRVDVLLAQFQERARGPLQPELERIWNAVRPHESPA